MATKRRLFFDTSALVKYFHEEPGSRRVIELIDDEAHVVWISALARVEFVSAVHRKRREQQLSEVQLQQALSGFEEALHAFRIVPLGPPVVERADALIRFHGVEYSLRTLDALHLATCLIDAGEGGAEAFVVADDRLYAVAQAEGVTCIHPMRDADDDATERIP